MTKKSSRGNSWSPGLVLAEQYRPIWPKIDRRKFFGHLVWSVAGLQKNCTGAWKK
ncbi:Hypothetical protein [Corynebacterium glutamicum ATCC 13032]|uniref:Uncharacterized protein n=1 Tax=Corynebacterium glutamicum (strain ATCC 13032 / DSM 20300 / JCM 1318 / BCRC 11384 / CCUG 27702 / LMG 3730 / NBRC 12168 / NCIMB 10025 / NRRL B-2784 / 534) TaxID=196627 RepID=Q8NP13_CORGL|nr:Hypothetical protein [Corynebacterium glutamicum ATCC 13032]